MRLEAAPSGLWFWAVAFYGATLFAIHLAELRDIFWNTSFFKKAKAFRYYKTNNTIYVDKIHIINGYINITCINQWSGFKI